MNTLEIAALGMQMDQARLDTLSQNLANVTTPGFKRRIDVQRPFSHLMATARHPVETRMDMSPGALRPSADPLDIVVDGGSFLELRTTNGLAYARGGRFHLDAEGFAVTASGERLQITGGDLRHTGAGTELSVDGQGNVRAGTEVIGRLRLVRFDDSAALQSLGGGLFGAGTAAMADDTGLASVRSGYTEASNVQSTREMVRLLETSRHFEAMQKVFQGYDEMIEKSIRKFGEI